MKIRRVKSNPTSSRQAEISFSRNYHRPHSQDIRTTKRVKFRETNVPSNSRVGTSAIPLREMGAPKSCHPKTSEYAYFRKLRKDAGRTLKSNPGQKIAKPSNFFEPDDSSGEMTHMAKQNFRTSKAPFLVEYSTPSTNMHSFVSPSGRPSDKIDGAKLPIEKLTPKHFDLSLTWHGDLDKNSESAYQHEHLFFRKRQRLCRWATETSSLRTDELSGHDLVSVLLDRLFPDNNDIKTWQDPELMKPGTNIQSEKLVSSKLDAPLRQLCWIDPVEDFIEPWMATGYRSSIDSEEVSKSPIENDSSFSSSLENFQLLASNHFEQFDECRDVNEYAVERRRRPLLLGWKFDEIEGASSLCGPSSLDNYSANSSLSTGYFLPDSEGHICGERKDMEEAFNCFPVALACLSNHLDWSGDKERLSPYSLSTDWYESWSGNSIQGEAMDRFSRETGNGYDPINLEIFIGEEKTIPLLLDRPWDGSEEGAFADENYIESLDCFPSRRCHTFMP